MLELSVRVSHGFIQKHSLSIYVLVFQGPMTVNLTLMACVTGKMIQIIHQTSTGSETLAAPYQARQDHPGTTRQVQVTHQNNPGCQSSNIMR